MIKAAAIAATIATAATVASAQSSPTSVSDARQAGPHNDPNEIVCRVENAIGSRLTRTRVCRTRAEWAEHKAQTRQVVDRVQNGRQTAGQ